MNIKQGDRGMPAQAARSFSLEKARPSRPQLNDPLVELAERITEAKGSAIVGYEEAMTTNRRKRNANLPEQASRASALRKNAPSAQQSTRPAGELSEVTAAVEDPALTKLHQAFATTDMFLILPLLTQAKGSFFFGNVEDPLTDPGTHIYVVSAIRSIGPRDGLEALLTTQMVATHGLAMQCFARAAIKDQTNLGVEVNINRASRLMRTFAGQVEALKKYRSKGEQHCTVEHVSIAIREAWSERCNSKGFFNRLLYKRRSFES